MMSTPSKTYIRELLWERRHGIHHVPHKAPLICKLRGIHFSRANASRARAPEARKWRLQMRLIAQRSKT